jgi:ribosomal protein S6--L-glutamate ligase
MKTWILSSDSEIPSTKMLLQALKANSFETEVLNPLELNFEFGSEGSSVFHHRENHHGEKLNLPGLVLPRLGWQSLSSGLRLIRFFESLEIPVFNSWDSLSKASDKLLSLQIFHQVGLKFPRTKFSPLGLKSEEQLFSKSTEHVFKTLQGSQGFGVTWAQDRRQALSQVDSFRTVQAPFLAQELIAESFGQDIRAFVMNGQVIAAMKRFGPPEDLRSNLHQGGSAEKVELTAAETNLVLKAAQSLGLFYAGVDLMRSSKGPLLLEANPCPGFEGISQVAGIDMASIFISELSSHLSKVGIVFRR